MSAIRQQDLKACKWCKGRGKDCKHCMLADFECQDEKVRFSKCVKTKNGIGMLLGCDVMDIDYMYCASQRRGKWLECRVDGMCGKEGRFWEAKE